MTALNFDHPAALVAAFSTSERVNTRVPVVAGVCVAQAFILRLLLFFFLKKIARQRMLAPQTALTAYFFVYKQAHTPYGEPLPTSNGTQTIHGEPLTKSPRTTQQNTKNRKHNTNASSEARLHHLKPKINHKCEASRQPLVRHKNTCKKTNS